VIRAIGVVVPAHNEEDLLPSCLAALHRAGGIAGVPVHMVVVADACGDRTAQRALAGGAAVLEIRARNVGAARAAGMRYLLGRAARLDPAELWLATTDADTIVPAGWLSQQLRYANRGWDAVVGTITIADWQQQPPRLPPLFRQRYRTGEDAHPHVHGANLGFRAAAYLAAGGFPPSPTAEDHALVRALSATGCAILRTSRLSVVTSARQQGRAPHGFSHLLYRLATADAAGLH
jgi:glycosyltransferase involved in cell wall biosynthesis